MKNVVKFPAMLLIVLMIFTSCQKDISMAEGLTADDTQTENRSMHTLSDDKQLIVLSAPSIYNDYYAEVFDQIIDFQADFANKIDGRDEVIILVDQDTRPSFSGKVPEYMLVDANIEDIWIRDFSPVIADKQIKFDYLPYYNDVYTSNLIDNSFEDFFYEAGLTYGKKSSLILDGGNVVDNGSGKIIVTDRFLFDNPHLTKSSAKKQLKKLTGASHVAIIPEAPGDATGHADGMVMWATANKILLHDLPKRVKRKVTRELNRAFPGVEIVVVPDYYEDESWGGFSSACNIFVNSLVTDQYIYVPTFGSPHDSEMIDMITEHADKEVVPVPAQNVCFMGGSVRCLTWQLKGENANILLEE